ncbi:MAG: sirohydrochlorin cobaltochelatase [Peptoniphilus sp.]|nr:sirohydrochlorin cobaltochelatase [Peptoniphilus sp.]MDD7363713.1 sirohydrochlorin cobaltochelatase [Bacillota bacterium]MDY6044098.1 sirohydrochlorin cobaltochelatase [Peptoniphilus sp.]
MKALLIAAFGTTHRDALKRDLDPVIERLKEECSDLDVTVAFTSRRVIERLKHRDGSTVLNETEAIRSIRERGIRDEDIYIQPLHIIAGREFEKLSIYEKDGIHIGEPLLYRREDLERFARKLWEESPEPTWLVGHGSSHSADKIYGELDRLLKEKDLPVVVSTLEETSGREEAYERFGSLGISEVTLRPLLLVAGDHAKNDIFGEEEDSYQSEMESRGFKVRPAVEGLGSLAWIRDMYAEKCRRFVRGEDDA